MDRSPLPLGIGVPLARDQLEGRSRDRQIILDMQFLHGDRVLALRQLKLGFVALQPGLGQADERIGSDDQRLLLAVEGISPAPVLDAARVTRR
jgi:hypothetical protein